MAVYGNNTTQVTVSIESGYYIFISSILSVAVVCGSAQTLIIIYVFFKNSAIWTPTNLLVLSFIILDQCLSTFVTPMVIVSNAFHRWVFGQGGCIYEGFLACFIGLSILTIMTVISVDRYIVIVKTHLKHYINTKSVVGVVAGSMTYALFWSLWPVIGWNSFTLEGIRTSCSINWMSKDPYDVAYIITLFVCCWFIPLIVMTFCYTSIYIKVRNETSRFRRGARTLKRLDTEVAKTTFAMICSYVVSWGPYSVVSLYRVFGDATNLPAILLVLPILACKLSVMWNPAIYIYRNRLIRRFIVDTFPCLSKCCGVSNTILAVCCVSDQRNTMESMPTNLVLNETTESITADSITTNSKTTSMQHQIFVAYNNTSSSWV